MLHGRSGNYDLLGLGLRRHAVGRMHGSAEDIVLFLNDRAEMATDTDAHRDAIVLGFRRDPGLHHDGSAHRVVDGLERRHDLVADRLDDRAVELVGRVFHDVETVRHRLAGLGIAELVVQLRAADDVSKHDSDFKVFCHNPAHKYLAQALNNTTISRQRCRRSTQDLRRPSHPA